MISCAGERPRLAADLHSHTGRPRGRRTRARVAVAPEMTVRLGRARTLASR